jgi:hypothetical protein
MDCAKASCGSKDVINAPNTNSDKLPTVMGCLTPPLALLCRILGSGITPHPFDPPLMLLQVLKALRMLWTHMGNVTCDQISGLGSMCGPAVRNGGDLPLWAMVGNSYFAVMFCWISHWKVFVTTS